jgi:hypothetical protein
MSFRDFRLPDVLKRFHLVTREAPGLFADRPRVAPSPLLSELLQFNVPLASSVGTEKVRSELIVAPMLVELKRSLRAAISFFSGVDLSVDPEAGLTGICDFLLSLGPEQFFVTAPVVALVEAKNENVREGMGQCAAEMVAAQLFNAREGNTIDTIYGAVTSGTVWRFMSLSGTTLSIDMAEYSINEPDQILGILASMVLASAIPPAPAA